jgi:hypothetical protein
VVCVGAIAMLSFCSGKAGASVRPSREHAASNNAADASIAFATEDFGTCRTNVAFATEDFGTRLTNVVVV